MSQKLVIGGLVSIQDVPNPADLTDGFLQSDGANYVLTPSVPDSGLANIVDDATPQLGGDLDLNGNVITGLSSADSPQFTGVNVGHASDSTITRVSAGILAIEGDPILTTSGISDAAYAAGWDADTSHAPSKNAIYDKVETLLPKTGDGSLVTVDASGFSGNLTTSDNTLQEIADAVDALDISGSGITDVVQDTTPQLGGDLDMNTHNIQTVTPTEMAYVHGVTSAIQTQISARLTDVVGDTTPQLGGDLDLNSHVITSLGTMAGAVDASGFGGNLDTSDDTLQEIANKVDALDITSSGIGNIVEDVTPQLGGDLDLNSHTILNLGAMANIVDASGFSGNLTTSDDTLQEIANAFDIFSGGGGGGLSNVVDDLTPQLGGNLDMNSHNIQTVTPTEMAYVHGVTSAIQTQIDSKQAHTTNLDTFSGITAGTGIATALGVNVGSAGAPVLFNGAGGTPTSLVLTNATGTPAALVLTNATGTPASLVLTNATGTPSSIGLDNGTNLPLTGIASSTTLALGVGTLELGNGSDTTLARSGAGDITIEGNAVYRASGTDVAIADGGTGRSTGTTAYALVATGTTATGAQQTLASGATTTILVGGGASALPVWTTATGTGAPVRATNAVLVTPNIGVPSAGTLTSCTGLPIAGVSGDTTTALGVGSLNIGHASDTTVTRVSAGVIAVEGSTILTTAAISDTVYGAGWDADTTHAPSKNAVYDKINALSGTGGDVTAASSFGTDNVLIRSDGTGKGVQSTGIAIDDSDAITGISSITVTTVSVSTLEPVSDDGAALGASGTAFSDLFLASGGVINFAAGNYTLTHSTGLLTTSGPVTVTGALSVGTSNKITAGTIELGNASDTTLGRGSAGVLTVEGSPVLLSGGALGTPSSGTLSGCGGLPITGITASTSLALGVGTIELGHANDTTLSRASAGVLAVEGVNILTATNIDDTAYDATSWDGDTTHAPSKNAVRDKLESLGGGGTVTATGGSLTSNALVLGAGSTDTKVVTGITTDGATKINLGDSGVTSGAVIFSNTTSGSISLIPPVGALGGAVVTLPAGTSKLPVCDQSYTFSGGGASRTITVPAANITLARIDAAQTFTGVQSFTSPDFTTSITTATTSFTAFAGATTLLTIGGTGASASLFAPSTLDTSSSITGAIRTSGGISAAKALNIGTTGTFGGNLTVGTSNSVTTGTIELGAASDTTIARLAAGVISIEGNSFATGYTTTAAAAGTTTLTVSSNRLQYFTGTTSSQTVVLPVTSTLTAGHSYTIRNNTNSGRITIQSSAPTTFLILDAGSSADVFCILTSGTSPASWSYRTYYAGAPQNSQTGSYTTILGDVGKSIFKPSGSASTWTIDSNANVGYPIGTIIEFINMAAASNTIAITSDTMTLLPAGTTGSRTLAQYGRANAEKVGATNWVISGNTALT